MSFMARQWGLKMRQQRWFASSSGKIWKERPCASCLNFSFLIALLFEFKPLHFCKANRIDCSPQGPMFCKYVTQLCDLVCVISSLACGLPLLAASWRISDLQSAQGVSGHDLLGTRAGEIVVVCICTRMYLFVVCSREWTRWSMAAALMSFCVILIG